MGSTIRPASSWVQRSDRRFMGSTIRPTGSWVKRSDCLIHGFSDQTG
ncbi:hypothetical protein A2U01_0089122, partial [Trifolium medium]|nr:hypothetical protein [Trifolium medium]